MSTVLHVAAIGAVAMAVLVAVTGYDLFYREPVGGMYRLRAVALWLVGALVLWWLAGKV